MLLATNPDVGGDVQQISPASWEGVNYQCVGGLVVSDDGSAMMATDCAAIYYNWNDRERLSLFSGIQLDSSGDLVGTPVTETFESSTYVSSHFAFSPKLDRIFYAAGSGNENGKALKQGFTDSGATKTTFSFSNANYNILHVGR